MEDNKKSKEEIKKELIKKELVALSELLLKLIILCGLFGYIGYRYSIVNDLNISYGIVWGCVFALGVAILETLNISNTINSIIYILIYFIAVHIFPTSVGVIILLLVLALYIVLFINIKTRDRTDEINKIYNKRNTKNTITNNNFKKSILDNRTKINENNIIDDNNDIFGDNERQDYEEQYECERCFKEISEKEYELHDGMCEECFIEVHTDKNGHFH